MANTFCLFKVTIYLPWNGQRTFALALKKMCALMEESNYIRKGSTLSFIAVDHSASSCETDWCLKPQALAAVVAGSNKKESVWVCMWVWMEWVCKYV